MTTPDRPQARRPGAGVPVDPVKLMALRYMRELTRPQLSAAIAALGLTYENGAPVRAGKDHLGKIERGQNNASQEVLSALCTVLECEPEAILPGGPRPEIPAEMVARLERRNRNDDLIEFAKAHGLRYKTRRVYYNLPLQEAFAAYENLQAAMRSGDESWVRLAEATFKDALAAAPRLPGTKAAA